ncbi:MAG: hypothetical protein K9I94_03785 [Bacteroidales bacterium]|nr:hypothetical protein [Bacteroidales bacterium]
MKHVILLLVSAMLTFNFAIAQDHSGFIYGTITTVDDDVYTGQIRWDDEEAYWFDFFNSEKKGNEYLRYLSREDMEYLEKRDESWEGLFDLIRVESHNEDFNHIFECTFGNIQTMEFTGRKSVRLTFKNNREMEVSGGSNDLGTTINIYDEEMGEVGLDWDRVALVEFLPTPNGFRSHWGNAIYGTLYTETGNEFAGYIQWDHDERMSTDKLDGDHKDGDISIPFEKLLSIEKTNRGCDVVTTSDKEFYLKGSNDVNSSNRGIIVNVPGLGRVDIDWDEFKKLELDPDHQQSGAGYKDYGIPYRLEGTVITENGDNYSGYIVYDLDETWDYEILQGEDKDMEYSIPFKHIKEIIPKNYEYSRIVMRDGKQLILGESHDVSDENYGILIAVNKEGYEYVPFVEVDKLVFK